MNMIQDLFPPSTRVNRIVPKRTFIDKLGANLPNWESITYRMGNRVFSNGTSLIAHEEGRLSPIANDASLFIPKS